MKTALLIHWTPSKEEYYNINEPSCSNSHWFPRLTKELIIRDIHTVAIEMPYAFNPNYNIWKKELERFDIWEQTILVGHSCGGGFLLHWLSENPNIAVWKVVLVAPRLDPFNELDDKKFFNFEIDEYLLQRRDIQIFHSTNDMKSIQASLKKILHKFPNFPIKYFQDYWHFCLNDLKSEKFPELLLEVIK